MNHFLQTTTAQETRALFISSRIYRTALYFLDEMVAAGLTGSVVRQHYITTSNCFMVFLSLITLGTTATDQLIDYLKARLCSGQYQHFIKDGRSHLFHFNGTTVLMQLGS